MFGELLPLKPWHLKPGRKEDVNECDMAWNCWFLSMRSKKCDKTVVYIYIFTYSWINNYNLSSTIIVHMSMNHHWLWTFHFGVVRKLMLTCVKWNLNEDHEDLKLDGIRNTILTCPVFKALLKMTLPFRQVGYGLFPWRVNMTHRIQVWYIYPHLPYKSTKCR